MRPNRPGVLTLQDHQPVPLREFVVSTRHKQRRSGLVSDAVAPAPVVKARVNFGNWIADCPFDGCKGAELVDPSDLRFWCLSCDNGGTGKWLRVEMPTPKKRAQIEAVLNKRASYRHRNWTSETVLVLKAENSSAGEEA